MVLGGSHGFLLKRRVAKLFRFAYAPYVGVHQLQQIFRDPATKDVGVGNASLFDAAEFHTSCIEAIQEMGECASFVRWDVPYYMYKDAPHPKQWQLRNLTHSQSKKSASTAPGDTKTETDSSAVLLAGDMLHRVGLHKAAHDVQMRSTRVIELDQSIDAILADMKPKGRYNIRLAQKHGVGIDICSIEDFYALHQKTCIEKGIAARSLSYIRDMHDIFGDDCVCYGAYVHKRLVATIMVLHFDRCASYLFGGTDREGTKTMASYAIQYHAIKAAKEKGMLVYDFMGISAGNKKYEGITRFKEKFGGISLHRMGSWDLVYHPRRAAVVRKLESIRAR